MANVSIAIGGHKKGLCPTFGAARDIESQTDLSLGECYDLLKFGRLKYEEAAVIILAGVRAAGKSDWELEGVGDQLFKERIMTREIRAALGRFLLAMLYSSEEAKKKFAAEMEKDPAHPSAENG